MLPVADSSTPVPVPGRVSYARIAEKREIPDLIELQVRSFAWFVEKGLRELFDEISPIRDFTGKVNGNTMDGTMKLETGPESRWTATKR